MAVVHIILPTKADPEYCIIAFATHPKKRRAGIGTAVLKQLITLYIQSKIWRCHIDHENAPSIRFFEKMDGKK